ncbi:MAG: hypothetical protein KDD73_01240 [Anaerolineales bacterium]|nr:hypothetical protein [Anaerolineales bacterium]MCB9126629.1 hypothetical protein [Ardenticatenales bacterium]
MLYANGFIKGLGLTDSYVVWQVNGRSVALVSMSLSVAKGLGQNHVSMIEPYEAASGQAVPTLEAIESRRRRPSISRGAHSEG